MKFEKYESDLSTTIAATVKDLLLVADMSKIDKQQAQNYIEMCEDEIIKKSVLDKLNTSEKVYFFNRLNVPKKLRDLGLGKELLQEVINYCNEKNIFLVNTASSSGDMSQNKLINFYIDSGMKLIHNEGQLAELKKLNKLYSKHYFMEFIYARTAHLNKAGLYLIRHLFINLLSLLQGRLIKACFLYFWRT